MWFEAPFASPIHRILHSVVHFLWWEYYVLVLVVGIAAFTLSHRSVGEAWTLAFAGGAGVGINLGGIGILGEILGVPVRLLWATGLGVGFGVVCGTAGFALGAGVRRAVATHGSGT